MKGKISFATLGCRVNQYETSVFSSMLVDCGHTIVPIGEECDITVINTCTVTAESDRKSRQLIRRAAKKSRVGVIVTGCFAEVSPTDAMQIDGVIAVVGNRNKSDVVEYINYYMGESDTLPETDKEIFEECSSRLTVPGRVRTFIKIEDGCECKCAYCIIPRARGPVRSKSPEIILKEASELVRKGSPEIILTGIEISAYGTDFRSEGNKYPLADLILDLSRDKELKRLALGSLDPTLMTDVFLDKVSKSEQLLRHFHISLQSGCSSVLRRMRRKYNASQAMEYIERIRRYFPDAHVSADIIVGFPGESEEEFLETVEFCRKADFLNLHIFPYSVREETEAAYMDGQVSEEEKKRRAAVLENIHRLTSAELMARYCNKGEPVHVLFEQKKNGVLVGHSEHYVELRVKGPECLVGKICAVIPNPDGTGVLV